MENVKNIAKAVSSRMPGEDRQMRIYLSVEDFFKRRGLFKEAMQIDEMKSLIALFKKTEYEFTLSQGLKRYQESGSTFSLEILLDKAFFDTRLRLFNELPNKEKEHAIFYESIEHDGFVLSTLLRGKALNYDEQLLRESLPESTLRISRGQVQELLKTQDYTSALKVVGKTEYGKYFAKDETPEKTIANAEKAFKIALLNHAKKSRIVHEFHIGIPLSFITLKEAEVNALTAIGVGIEVAMKPENIRQALVLPI